MTTPTTRTVSLSPNAFGTTLSKYLCVLAQSEGDHAAQLELSEKYCRSVPSLESHFRHVRTKAATGAAATAGGWGGDLAPYEAGKEFFQLLQSASLWGRLAPRCRRQPFRSKVARENAAGAGASWSGEGLARPFTDGTLSTLQMEFSLVNCIVVVSRELLQFGAVAEQSLRRAVLAGASRFVDSQLLTPSVTASALHPASIVAGAYAVSSTGTTGAQIAADLATMLAKIEGGGDGLVWILRPTTYARILAALGSIGYHSEPNVLFGLPVIAGSTSPAQVALVDCANIAVAFDETDVAIDVTMNADVEMYSGSSSQSGLGGVGVQLVSLFQTSMAAIRASFACSWQTIHYSVGSPSVPLAACVMPVSY